MKNYLTVDDTFVNTNNIDMDEVSKKIKNDEIKKNWVHHEARSEHEIAKIALAKMKAIEKEKELNANVSITKIHNGYVRRFIQ